MFCYSLRLKLILTCWTLGCLTATAGRAEEVDVSPGNLDGWVSQTDSTATVEFVNGPLLPPCGTGSVELSVGSDGNSGAQLRNGDYDGELLEDITSLNYSTFVQQDGLGGQAPYIILNVDLD